MNQKKSAWLGAIRRAGMAPRTSLAPVSVNAAARSALFPATAARPSLGFLRRTMGLEPGDVRRGLQIALALVWLLDAALQYQPFMFTHRFVTQILEAAAGGNPAAVLAPSMWAARLIGHDVAAWNAAFATIQLAIAVGMLWRPTVRMALAASIAWSLGVWWLAEGMGEVLTGTASPVTGAPGAVILYALAAVLVWPRRGSDPRSGGIAAASPLGDWWSRATWLVLWGSFAYLILQPAVRAPRALAGTIVGNAAGEPGWLAALDRGTAAAVGSHGLTVSIVLAVIFAIVAVGILFATAARTALILATVVGLAIWVIGENFGGILTGQGTDPNSGLLLILLIAAYWPVRPGQPRPPGASPRWRAG
jgi:hypothetical protein